MDSNPKKILITGGAGFVGTHLCKKYIEEGHKVFCYDNFMNGSLNNIRDLLGKKNFKLVNGDVRDVAMLEKVVPESDVIIHLAAQIHVDRSIIEPKLTYDINLNGTLNVLELARLHDVEKVLHASTSEVYGSGKTMKMDENHMLDPPHPYGASKVAADRLCSAFSQTYGMNIKILRPFNIFGPHQKDSGYGGVISIFVRRVANDIPPVIHGDGSQTRDYTYIHDIVRAYDALLKIKNKIGNEPINFGTGKEYSILTIANIIIKVLGKEGKIEPVFVEPRPGQVMRLCADITKAKETLNWEPEWKIEEGIKDYINWFKKYKFEAWSKPGGL